ncbi:NADH dehydrogenase [ubiquinone] 1 beta subcomplex subunit 4 [Lithobates pipiens]
MAEYKESRFVSRPETLNPAQYYELTPEKRRLQEERVTIRAKLKREYQLQLNDPKRKGLVPDPAVDRWMFARSDNIYPNSRLTPSVLLRALGMGGPMLLMYFAIKWDRERKLREIREGKHDDPFSYHV